MPETELLMDENACRPEQQRSGFIAVIGRPNVGKSTLLNLLLGQKIAITSDKPQTTRDQIMGIRTDADAQFIFLDTPGIHLPRTKLGKHMVNVAEQSITGDADVILLLVDINTPPTSEEALYTAWSTAHKRWWRTHSTGSEATLWRSAIRPRARRRIPALPSR